MTIKELKRILDSSIKEDSEIENDNIVIAIEKGEEKSICCGTRTVGVKNVFFGFDWDKGKLILYPTDSLIKITRR